MPSLRRRALSYFADSSPYFEWLADAPYPVFLDAGKPYSDRGRFSVITADPDTIISFDASDNTAIGVLISEAQEAIEGHTNAMASLSELPFCGGAIGYLSYELGEAQQLSRPLDCDLPALLVGIYSWAIVVDHQQQHCELVVQGCCQSHWAQRLLDGEQPDGRRPATSHAGDFKLESAFHSPLDWPAYRQRFAQIQDYILAGDCYQINLTRQFSARYSGSPWQAYQRLRRAAAAPFSAYWDFGQGQLLSLSPERFIRADGGQLQTQPIKGTAARASDPKEDARLAEELQASEKNRAENVMIVDLLRNDLSRNCIAGSVQAENLLELQSFRTVHHLVSTVSGSLRADITPLAALLDCFPGGSITGAPKRRAMEIIAELEPSRRSLYCGSLFYLSASGHMDSSITIRSFVCKNGVIRGWAGGGIVADSVAEEEFQETEEKLGKLMRALAELND